MDKLLRGYTDESPLEYAEFCLCREMGWTYDELESQPAHRISQAFTFIGRENAYRKTLED